MKSFLLPHRSPQSAPVPRGPRAWAAVCVLASLGLGLAACSNRHGPAASSPSAVPNAVAAQPLPLPTGATSSTDPSVPAASDVFRHRPAAQDGEPVPTF